MKEENESNEIRVLSDDNYRKYLLTRTVTLSQCSWTGPSLVPDTVLQQTI